MFILFLGVSGLKNKVGENSSAEKSSVNKNDPSNKKADNVSNVSTSSYVAIDNALKTRLMNIKDTLELILGKIGDEEIIDCTEEDFVEEKTSKKKNVEDMDLDIIEELLQNISKKHWKVNIERLPKIKTVKQVNKQDTLEKETESKKIISAYPQEIQKIQRKNIKNIDTYVKIPSYTDIDNDYDMELTLKQGKDEVSQKNEDDGEEHVEKGCTEEPPIENVFVVADETAVKETEDDIGEHTTSLTSMGTLINEKKKIIGKIFKRAATACNLPETPSKKMRNDENSFDLIGDNINAGDETWFGKINTSHKEKQSTQLSNRNGWEETLKLTESIGKSTNSLACFEDSNLLGVQIVELEEDSSITGGLNQILAPDSQVRQELLSLLSEKVSNFPLIVEVEVDIYSSIMGEITKVKNNEDLERMEVTSESKCKNIELMKIVNDKNLMGVQTYMKNIGNVVTFT